MKELNARKSLDKKLSPLRTEVNLTRPHRGWIKAIREALGMTTAQLGHRMGVSQPRITEIERAEIEDKITISSLRRAAEAMNCTLVYAIVPDKTLEDVVHERALQIAIKILGGVSHTMALENQSLTKQDLKNEIEYLARDLMLKKSRSLWENKL